MLLYFSIPSLNSRTGKAFGALALGPLILAILFSTAFAAESEKTFRAGASVADITPTNFPVIVNAMFEERTATKANDPLRVRSLALNDGNLSIVIAVVDSCMVPRDLLDEAKRIASSATGIPAERMLISATHTHSAPSAMGCLGSRVDPVYARFLPGRIAQGIERAVRNLAPARIGWGSVDDYKHTFCRRWIRRPDKMLSDPFGEKNVRANMHPGYQNPDAIGPSGPVDPALSFLSVQTPDGKPLALLANYSMHYYESPLLSADYYGVFATNIADRIGAVGGNEPFVGIMSQGTSGDQMWMNYGASPKQIGMNAYAQEVAELIAQAYSRIEYHAWVPLAMAETKLTLGFRLPDQKRLAWANELAGRIGDRSPRGMAEIYAKEAIYLHQRPTAELILQALRIGDLGITAIPNEVYAITGLKLKAQSPLALTFNIELANGSEGYIPPPEQHRLGGYTTWPARTAGLETNAEPQIVEALIKLLEKISGQKRHPVVETHGEYAQVVLASKPASYWRLNEFSGTTATDATGNGRSGEFEGNVAFYLDGPQSSAFSGGSINRAPHFAGGYLKSSFGLRTNSYSMELWFWNGLSVAARSITGYLFSLGPGSDQLFIGGTNSSPGHLLFTIGTRLDALLPGKSAVKTRTWNHLVLVRHGRQVSIYLNGELDISGEAEPVSLEPAARWIVAGNVENQFNLEGKVDEIAFYDSALTADEVARHFKISRMEVPLASKPVPPEPNGAYVQNVLALKPLSYWRLSENGSEGRAVSDLIGKITAAVDEEGVELHQLGPQSSGFSGSATNHAPLFNGGRIKALAKGLGSTYSVSFWLRNELPNNERPVTGYLFSRGVDGAQGAPGDHLGIGGTHQQHEGRILFFNGNQLDQVLVGDTVIEPRSWNNLVLVRDGKKLAVYLNGNARPEISGEAESAISSTVEQVFIGGRNDNFANFQGRIDEVALFNRALTPDEVVSTFRVSGLPSKPLAVPRPPPKLSSLPKSPPESMALLHLPNSYAAELVAAEPMVSSPVAIDWGLDGKLWVVEMADYPYGIDGKMKPGGRVKFLEDTNGDGRFDKSTIFLEGLNFPNGIITWRNGVIVTAAPDIFYAEDTDGDGKADKREVLFTGFAQGNLQLRVNGLRWGLDNWLHCANGWSGGEPRSIKTGAKVNINGRDLRFQPDKGWIEAESGQSEFGRNPDDWGSAFGCDNSYPLFHFVLEDRYMGRNPYVPAPESKRQLYLPSNPKVYPRSSEQKRYHSFEHVSHFTSACSTDFYRDEQLFPRGRDQHVFSCEPVHNLIQHLLVREEGVSFSAHRAESESENDFIASEDQWFRPVMARTGPDGGLWIVDMYRYMIEHPDWLPPEGRRELEPFYRAGEERGRIYRIVRSDAPMLASRSFIRLDKLSSSELVAALGNPNGWIRDKAQQCLLWRNDRSAVDPLEKVCASSANALARLHALCTLDGLGALRLEVLESALLDAAPAVRRHAVRAAESMAVASPPLLEALAKLANDSDAKVRLQLACSLGQWDDSRAGDALAHLALANPSDPYTSAAIMSSAPHHVAALVTAIAGRVDSAAQTFTGPLLSLTIALNRRDLVAQLLAPSLAPSQEQYTAFQMQSFAGFLDILKLRNVSLAQVLTVKDDALTHLLHRAGDLFVAARQIASTSDQSVSKRIAAVSLLGRDESQCTNDLRILATLLTPRTPGGVQRAAVKAAAISNDPNVPDVFLKNWPSHLPEIRSVIIDELMARESWTLELCHRIERGELSTSDLGVARADRLLKHRAENISRLAKKLFASSSNPDRQKAIDEFRPALTLASDPQRGRSVFTRACSVCHQLEGVGREIGPNLISVRGHPAEKLLTSILDPSREVEPRYLAYNCALSNGEELYGLVGSETGNGIQMKLPDGTVKNILRSEIKSLHNGKTSLMPDGLEVGLSKQDLADLIGYLKWTPGEN